MVLGLPSRPHRVGMSVPFLGASRLSHTALAVGGVEGIDMGFGIQGVDASARHHRRGGQARIGIRALAGIGVPDFAQGARRCQVIHGVGGIAARLRPVRIAIRRAAASPATLARVGSGLSASSSVHQRNALALEIGFLAAGLNQLPIVSMIAAAYRSQRAAAAPPTARPSRQAVRKAVMARRRRRARLPAACPAPAAARAAARCRNCAAPPLCRKAAKARARFSQRVGACGSSARAGRTRWPPPAPCRLRNRYRPALRCAIGCQALAG